MRFSLAALTVAITVSLLAIQACGSSGDSSDGAATNADESADETSEPSSSSAFTVVDAGFTTNDDLGETWVNAGAMITGDAEEVVLLDVTFDFRDAAGASLTTERATIRAIPGSGELPTEVSAPYAPSQLPASVEVSVQTRDDVNGGLVADEVVIEVSDVAIEPGGLGAELTGTITNTTDTEIEASAITCVLVRDDASVVGGTSTRTAAIAAGAVDTWSTRGDEVEAAWVEGATGATCRGTGLVR